MRLNKRESRLGYKSQNGLNFAASVLKQQKNLAKIRQKSSNFGHFAMGKALRERKKLRFWGIWVDEITRVDIALETD